MIKVVVIKLPMLVLHSSTNNNNSKPKRILVKANTPKQTRQHTTSNTMEVEVEQELRVETAKITTTRTLLNTINSSKLTMGKAGTNQSQPTIHHQLQTNRPTMTTTNSITNNTTTVEHKEVNSSNNHRHTNSRKVANLRRTTPRRKLSLAQIKMREKTTYCTHWVRVRKAIERLPENSTIESSKYCTNVDSFQSSEASSSKCNNLVITSLVCRVVKGETFFVNVLTLPC